MSSRLGRFEAGSTFTMMRLSHIRPKNDGCYQSHPIDFAMTGSRQDRFVLNCFIRPHSILRSRMRHLGAPVGSVVETQEHIGGTTRFPERDDERPNRMLGRDSGSEAGVAGRGVSRNEPRSATRQSRRPHDRQCDRSRASRGDGGRRRDSRAYAVTPPLRRSPTTRAERGRSARD